MDSDIDNIENLKNQNNKLKILLAKRKDYISKIEKDYKSLKDILIRVDRSFSAVDFNEDLCVEHLMVLEEVFELLKEKDKIFISSTEDN
jgi:hypothetical protein